MDSIKAAIGRIALASLLAIGSMVPSSSLAADRLASPYRLSPAMPRAVAPLKTCPQPPPPVLDVNIGSPYANGDWTRIIPELVKKRQAATLPLNTYVGKIIDLSNQSLLLTGQNRAAAAACVDKWLAAWMTKGALLGKVSWPDGQYERKWSIIAVGLAYLAAHSREDTRNIPTWLSSWFMQATTDLPARYPDVARAKNNHWYWAGLTSIVAGTMANDPIRYAWGIKQYRLGLSAVDPNGFLPLELLRGEGALGYHAFSASALVTIAAFEKANGRPPVGDDLARLKRLVQRVLSGLANPSEFQKRSGARQKLLDPAAVRTYSWLETYYELTADPAAEPWVRALRPMKVVWLGGDVTAAFGKPVKAGPVATSPLIKK